MAPLTTTTTTEDAHADMTAEREDLKAQRRVIEDWMERNRHVRRAPGLAGSESLRREWADCVDALRAIDARFAALNHAIAVARPVKLEAHFMRAAGHLLDPGTYNQILSDARPLAKTREADAAVAFQQTLQPTAP